MTSARRGLILIAALIIAGILAFPLRETIYGIVVIPAAYIAWNLNLVYQSFSQGVWWWVIAFIVFFMIAFSLMPRPQLRSRGGPKSKPPRGQVESLSIWLRRAESGTYFKWLIANRLGKLAYQILLHRECGRPRSVFAPLLGMDWEPTKELREYLETGLHGSFADFPNNGRLSAHQPTPLDFNVAEAVDFLDLQVNNQNSPRSQEDTENL
ncbi:MAG TPA: hypothetical protein VF918_13925 [Anaerolineales bacterium]